MAHLLSHDLFDATQKLWLIKKDCMTKEEKPIKIEFAPGAFDNFDGTQEELDELVAEIQNMFLNKTPEEINAMSRPLTDEDLEELPDEVKETLIREALGETDSTPPRTLQ